MIINEVTVNATASKNYQKVEISIAASIENEHDIDTLQTLAIRKALKGINELTGDNIEEPKVNTTVQTPAQPPVQRSAYPTTPVQRPTTPNYYANAPQNQPYSPQNVVQQPGVKMASEKQIQLLRKFHVQCDFNNLTAAQANNLIQGVMSERQ